MSSTHEFGFAVNPFIWAIAQNPRLPSAPRHPGTVRRTISYHSTFNGEEIKARLEVPAGCANAVIGLVALPGLVVGLD